VEALSGPIEDLSWDFESKRLLAVGGGASYVSTCPPLCFYPLIQLAFRARQRARSLARSPCRSCLWCDGGYCFPRFDSKAKFFVFDTGANIGDVIPLSKKALCCDLKPCRPFTAALGGAEPYVVCALLTCVAVPVLPKHPV
jgi:hypothetical protein